jgi:hypothetical protein
LKLSDHVAERQGDRTGLDQPPRLAGYLAVVDVQLALDEQPFADLAGGMRVDRADHVLGIPEVRPVQRDRAAALPPGGERLLERALDDQVAWVSML